MLKPFYIKKKNIDNRLVPEVSAADAGKVLGVTEDGSIAPVEAGGGNIEPYAKGILQIKLSEDSNPVELPANSVFYYTENNVMILILDSVILTTEYQNVNAYIIGTSGIPISADSILAINPDITGACEEESDIVDNCIIIGVVAIPFNDFNFKFNVVNSK